MSIFLKLWGPESERQTVVYSSHTCIRGRCVFPELTRLRRFEF